MKSCVKPKRGWCTRAANRPPSPLVANGHRYRDLLARDRELVAQQRFRVVYLGQDLEGLAEADDQGVPPSHEVEGAARPERARGRVVPFGQLGGQRTECGDPVGRMQALAYALHPAEELGEHSHLRRSSPHVESRLAPERGHGVRVFGAAEIEGGHRERP